MSEERISLSDTQSHPADSDYTPPVAAVPLPSQGKVYASSTTLANKETIEIRAMTAKDEDILTSKALLKSGKVLDVLLKSCIVDRSINVDQMLVGDRNAALVAIRITGYGQGYEVEVPCPKCEARVRNEFDLARLPVKQLGASPIAPNVNEFSFTLPVSKKEVVFRLLSGADEQELSQYIERMKKSSGGIDSLVTTRLLMQIVSLGGERDRAKLPNLVRNMPARDSRDLRSYIEKISPGVDMKQTFICSSCSEESEVEVPMGVEFFWPEA